MKRTEPKRYMMKLRLNINYKFPESFCFYSIILIGVKMLRLCFLLFVSAQLIAHQNKTKAKLIIMTLHNTFSLQFFNIHSETPFLRTNVFIDLRLLLSE